MSRFHRTAILSMVAIMVFGFGVMNASAQSVFGDKLGFIARNNSNQATVLGTGWVRATLNGSTLSVEGEFEGLGSPATVAHIHFAPPGQHGPVVFPLEIEGETEGTLSGTFELTQDQLDALAAGNFYVNVHTEANPGGQIRAWLMPIE
jgi:hypothetical protein